ncbi:MAG: hypothetical protein V3V14_01680 [Saprospiraceae bacterium]
MTLKQLIKLEDKANEIWVISPTLHYDIDNNDFTELVSVNLGEKTKYRYIVPSTKTVLKNISKYKKMYNVTEKEIKNYFLILPVSEFNPFITEMAIYNPNTECIACAAPALEDSNKVIQFNSETSKNLASSFKKLWKKFKRINP